MTPQRTLDALRKYQKELNELQDMVTLFGSFTHEESSRAIELKSKINQLLDLKN